ncbi:2Fe-2S iron-sulfur cluster-binding protein [Candidatus Bathycorpusculum sp.]|uniref:2Fe-2S iron-sulfur cluster-binding protein n=1 Tax=Candidatus Bathycorpusculum sp. TaxID=2994959 RepID=UPI0028234B63|nr:2Fe-2S iron-sulfur cluster-binding protein [Candidatus Termitimicrobium sp.]MCL2685067.1 2Fe-2S iron-sulfur cluster-binding protein [Candidatus Termitimicrobium sp.]
MNLHTLKLKIDGIDVECTEGSTILTAAKAIGINIPTLCYLDGLTPYGGCRLCIVEVSGTSKLFPACATPVASGMEVTTQSPKLYEYRKMVLETLLAERTHICAVCVANDHCELQALANQHGIDHVSYERNWSTNKIDSTHDSLVIDPNRCILCTRCIRVCDELEGVHTLDLKFRGKNADVIMDQDEPWVKACSCTSCRKCAKVCPVGAIYVEGENIETTKIPDVAAFIVERRKRLK